MSGTQNKSNAQRDRHLAKAEEARQHAASATSPQERAQWNNIADVWEYIARHALPAPAAR
jgi:hypothetical protein